MILVKVLFRKMDVKKMEKFRTTRLEKDVWILAKTRSIQEEKSVEDVVNPILRKALSEGGDLVE